MDYNCKIKLGSVNNLTDARFGASAGAEWVGFNFHRAHAAYISPVQAQAIIGWLAGPLPVAEFGAAQNLNEIEDIIRLLGFEWIQLAEPGLLHYFEGSDIHIILETDADKVKTVLPVLTNEVKVLLVKNYSPEQVKELAALHPQLLFDVEGLTPDQLQELKGQAPYGINISGGFETAPGLRDFDEMSAVFELFGE